jgi:hypothetical protein
MKKMSWLLFVEFFFFLNLFQRIVYTFSLKLFFFQMLENYFALALGNSKT